MNKFELVKAINKELNTVCDVSPAKLSTYAGIILIRSISYNLPLPKPDELAPGFTVVAYYKEIYATAVANFLNLIHDDIAFNMRTVLNGIEAVYVARFESVYMPKSNLNCMLVNTILKDNKIVEDYDLLWSNSPDALATANTINDLMYLR